MYITDLLITVIILLQFPITRKEHGGITYVEFSRTVPYNFAVTSSAKV